MPRPRLASVLVGAGVATLCIGAVVVLQPWYLSQQWRASPEAARAQRNADAPTPIWITPAAAGTAVAGRTPIAPPRPQVVAATAGSTATPAAADVVTPAPAAPVATSRPVPPTAAATIAETPTPVVSSLTLGSSAFQFLDPPEPGASARLSVSVHNPTDSPSQPISLVLPLTWLAGYRVQTVQPAPLDGAQVGAPQDESLSLTFDGPAAGSQVDLSVEVVAVDEVIDAPLLRVIEANGAQVGQVRPPTEAPPPRPGPIYSIDIPNLRLHAGVVPVDWEPPLFVVGQVRASAHVTQGNSVLVGHVRGAAGYNIFDHLDQLSPGDSVVASSRGETYDFVVSQTRVLPADDTSPTEPTASARLTMMTCAGVWNPLTRDYSDRLWVIAEPPRAAAATIAAQSRPTPAPRPTQFSQRGGLGNTDADLASAFGPPTGESGAGLAVYRASGPSATLQHRAQFADRASGSTRRAVLVAAVPPPTDPLAFDAAKDLSRALLPVDAVPRGSGPEGNARFVVERFASPALAAALPAEWFADTHAEPGDVLVVYSRRADGRITSVAVGIGDDAQVLLSRLDS